MVNSPSMEMTSSSPWKCFLNSRTIVIQSGIIWWKRKWFHIVTSPSDILINNLIITSRVMISMRDNASESFQICSSPICTNATKLTNLVWHICMPSNAESRKKGYRVFKGNHWSGVGLTNLLPASYMGIT